MIVVKFIIFDLTGYLQVNSSMSSSMPGLEWPPAFVAINKFINGIFNLKFLTEVGSMDCWLGTNYCFRVMCLCLTLLSFQVRANPNPNPNPSPRPSPNPHPDPDPNQAG